MLEHEVRFRRVDEKVAEHIAELYKRLYVLFKAVDSYVQLVETTEQPTKDEKLELVRIANREFNDCFFLNRLYIPPRLFETSNTISRKLQDIAEEVTRDRKREAEGRPTKDRDQWLEAMEAIERDVNPLFVELVTAFQNLLGVEDVEDNARI